MVSVPCRESSKAVRHIGAPPSKNQHIPTESTKINIAAHVVVHVYTVLTWEDDTGES